MRETDFNQFIRQRVQPAVAEDNFPIEQNLSPVFQSELSEDIEDQLKPVYKVIDFVDCRNRRICVTLLQYKMDKSETSYAQVRFLGRKKEEKILSKFCMSTINLTNFNFPWRHEIGV